MTTKTTKARAPHAFATPQVRTKITPEVAPEAAPVAAPKAAPEAAPKVAPEAQAPEAGEVTLSGNHRITH